MPVTDGEFRALNALPLLSKARPAQRVDVLGKKVKFCTIVCDFNDINADLKFKQTKRQTLIEITEYVGEAKGVLTEGMYGLCVAMFSANVFRGIPPKIPDYDPAEDEPIVYNAWPHLELVYRFFINLIESPEFIPAKAKKYFTFEFVINLVDMFKSDDSNERDNLKTILHRVYAKFLGLRAVIRKQISVKLLEVTFEYFEFPGVTEVLEVMGSVINGYVTPYKTEHVHFLYKVLLPLHGSHQLQMFHAQLVYCIIQFIEKEQAVVQKFVLGFLKLWPKTNSVKEVMFLGELEEMIDVIQPAEFTKLQQVICSKLASCIKSPNYQVAERALFFWENEYVVSLLENSSTHVYPVLLPSLMHASQHHWNRQIAVLASDVVRKFMQPEEEAFNSIVLNVKQRRASEARRRASLNRKWECIAKLADKNKRALSEDFAIIEPRSERTLSRTEILRRDYDERRKSSLRSSIGNSILGKKWGA